MFVLKFWPNLINKIDNASYNASAVKIYKATSNLVRFENNFSMKKRSSLVIGWAPEAHS
jgi:hypothetical protein